MCPLFRLPRSRSPSPPDNVNTNNTNPAMNSEPANSLTLLSRRKLASAATAHAASGRDSLSLRRVVLIQNSISSLRPPPSAAPPELQTFTRQMGEEERAAEERWFDAVLGELDLDLDVEDDAEHVSVVAVDNEPDTADSESDGFPNLDDFFLLGNIDVPLTPPPPYSSASPPTTMPEPNLDPAPAFFPPPLPDSFAADGWDEFDDGSEKLSIATLFEFDLATEKPVVVLPIPLRPAPIAICPTAGRYPPSPYEIFWPTL